MWMLKELKPKLFFGQCGCVAGLSQVSCLASKGKQQQVKKKKGVKTLEAGTCYKREPSVSSAGLPAKSKQRN